MATTLTTIPLGDRPFVSPYTSIGKEICRNLYLEIAQSATAKASYYFIKCPGLRLLSAQSSLAACRGMFGANKQRIFGVWGNLFVEILQNGTRIVRGSTRAFAGNCNFAQNGYQLIMVDGDSGYIFDFATNTFTRITDSYFPGADETTLPPTHVVALDTYFLVNAPGSNAYYWSNPYYKNTNGSDYSPTVSEGYWNAINSGAKIGKSDPIVSLGDAQNMMWVFGAVSTEVHYDSGEYQQLWQRYSGALIDIGCAAPYSVASYATQIFWIGSDNVGTVGIFSNEGMLPKRISTRGIEQVIQAFPRLDDAIGRVYAQDGHVFYLLQFPTADKTFVYDTVTSAWHERTFLDPALGSLKRWRGTHFASAWDKVHAGDNNGDAVYVVDKQYFANDNPEGNGTQNYIQCVKTTPINFQQGLRVRYASAQPILQQGVGLETGLVPGTSTTDPLVAFGKYPKCAIAWSDDCGNTWSAERLVDIGALGKYATRTRTLNCGMSRNRVWRLTITDPVDVILVGLLVETEVMKS